MQVKLISVTQPVNDSAYKYTAEELIVYIARVSNPSNQANFETADKLLRHLIKNKHWSPFDMVNMCIEVTTSKAIGIQILRHWSIKPQEFSQRYAKVTDIEDVQLRKQGITNRQSSTEEFNPIINNDYLCGDADHCIQVHMDNCLSLYNSLIDAGVAKECARMVLPMATSTTMYLNGSIRSWIHYLEQRCDEHAQLEHQQVAAEIKTIFTGLFPNVSKAIYG